MVNISLICYILLLFHSPKSPWKRLAKFEEFGRYWSYCTRNRAITNAYIMKYIHTYIYIYIIYIYTYIYTLSMYQCMDLLNKHLLWQHRIWTHHHLLTDWAMLWVLICTVHLTLYYYRVAYVFQSESTLYSYLNVKVCTCVTW